MSDEINKVNFDILLQTVTIGDINTQKFIP